MDRVEVVMSKPPDDVDALLLHLRTLKWQAATILASSPNGIARENAAAEFATFDALVTLLGTRPGPEVVKAIRRRIEALALMRDREPASEDSARPRNRAGGRTV
jgi:hypothetical protein